MLSPTLQWQKAFDPLLTPGARNYWKSHNFTELADGALNSDYRVRREAALPAVRDFHRTDCRRAESHRP